MRPSICCKNRKNYCFVVVTRMMICYGCLLGQIKLATSRLVMGFWSWSSIMLCHGPCSRHPAQLSRSSWLLWLSFKITTEASPQRDQGQGPSHHESWDPPHNHSPVLLLAGQTPHPDNSLSPSCCWSPTLSFLPVWCHLDMSGHCQPPGTSWWVTTLGATWTWTWPFLRHG